MFGFLKKFLNKIGLAKSYEYTDGLIRHFEEEHKELFSLYEEILKNVKRGNYLDAFNTLQRFGLKYRVHIQLEDNKLYTYLGKVYSQYPDILEWIEQKQDEMNNITGKVLAFAKKFNSVEQIKHNKEEFRKELEELGRILTQRVKMEQEKLYPLYAQKEHINPQKAKEIIK